MSFLASFWSLKSRPPMQSAVRIDFGSLFCCLLHPLLCFVLCMFSPLPGWHFCPPCRSLGGLIFELSGVIFVSGITYCHAVWILPCFWLTLKAVQVFGIRLPFKPCLSASWKPCFSSFLASFWSLKSRPPMQSALRVDFCTLSCSMLHHLLLLVLCMFPPHQAGI